MAEWRVLSEKLPKGFEKYFQSKDKPAEKESAQSSSGDASKSAPPAASSDSSSKSSTDLKWKNALRFNSGSGRSSGGGGGGGGNSGKPIGGGEDSDKEKWLLFGAVSALAIAGAIIYFEVGYKEIGWKEFVNK